jgi:hypothetical protein
MHLLSLGGGQRGGPNLGWGFVIFMLVVFSTLAVRDRLRRRSQRDTQQEPDPTPGPGDDPTQL